MIDLAVRHVNGKEMLHENSRIESCIVKSKLIEVWESGVLRIDYEVSRETGKIPNAVHMGLPYAPIKIFETFYCLPGTSGIP